jgi:hypothetical protein
VALVFAFGSAAQAGVARIIGNTLFSNSTGINPAGGSICLTGNNRFAGNSKNGSPSVNTGACLITTQSLCSARIPSFTDLGQLMLFSHRHRKAIFLHYSSSATKAEYADLQLEARLGAAEISLRPGGTSPALRELTALQHDASARGFGLIARKASTLASGHQ